jgi:hypothetical protein
LEELLKDPVNNLDAIAREIGQTDPNEDMGRALFRIDVAKRTKKTCG